MGGGISSQGRYATGVIHGRFQILHNDHLRYLLAGAALCEHLVVGITNPDPLLSREDQADPHRTGVLSNPLTYYERQVMVRAALREAGLQGDDLTVVPLPINLPELYHYYVPMQAIFFLTIYDDWGRRKRDIFQALGLRTHVLWEVHSRDKGISGHQVRERMCRNQPWEHLVPLSVAALVRAWDIPARLQELSQRH